MVQPCERCDEACTLPLPTAEEVVLKWLKDVNAQKRLEERVSSCSTAPQEEGDYLGSVVDWYHGNVAENARSVVEGLLEKDLHTPLLVMPNTPSSKLSHDPRITMDMRHKKVCTLARR